MEEHSSGEVGLDLNRVEHAVHLGEHEPLGHECGVDPHLDSPFPLARDGQQLDLVSELTCVLEVVRAEPGYALAVDIRVLDSSSKGQCGQNRELEGGIRTVDVVGGVRLGEAELLGFPQGLLETGPVLGHPGEDVVGGSVDDAVYGQHVIGDQVAN